MQPGGKQAAVVLGAIGVVFGDIGTSPLYTLRTVFAPEHGLDPSREAVFGVVSLIFWAVTLIVSVKYVTFIMRADNDGEGGIMALIALIQRANLRSRGAQIALVLLGVFGASLFYGDGMITPAISRAVAPSRASRWSTRASRRWSSRSRWSCSRSCSSPSASAPARSAGSSGRSWSSGSACSRSAA